MKTSVASTLMISLILPGFLQGTGCGPADPAPSKPGPSTTASGSLTGSGGAGGTQSPAATAVENAVVTGSSVTGSSGATGSTNGAGASGTDGTAGAAGAGGAPNSECLAEETWRQAARFALVDPLDFGADPDGETDATAALEAAVEALPDAGGIVRFRAGTYLKQRKLWTIRKNHVLLWAPDGRATLHGTVRAQTDEEKDDPSFCGPREQATIFQRVVGGGVHGLRFSSDAEERLSCAESNQIVLDAVQGFEISGVEISGSSGTGVFAWHSDADDPTARDLRIVGNYVHHTYADSIHHTRGTERSWVWDNVIFNEAPSLGDDGVACVTYGVESARCRAMEWWNNRYLGGAHGRGMAVIGGEDIAIHHNWIIGSASAGLIVASEAAYDTASSERIELRDNWLLRSPNGSVDNGHSAILVSGNYAAAPPISEVEAVGNVIVDPAGGRSERAEGNYENVHFDNSTDRESLPEPVPELGAAKPRPSRILRTWDVSFVPEQERRGLYRIHLREADDGGLDERFEYVVTGPTAEVDEWLETFDPEDCASQILEARALDDQSHALVVSGVPLQIPSALEGVSFEALRTGDRDGTLGWLWQRLDGASE